MSGDYRSDPLWLRLAFLERSGGPSAATLHSLVVADTGWTPEFAKAVIEEYRRFLFLAMRTGHAVKPPPAIDRVWQLHRAHAPNYWDVLSQFVVDRPAVPSVSTGADNDTRASYLSLFGAAPPPAVWSQGAADPKPTAWHRLLACFRG
jgi:hypothetical protein